MSNHILFSLLFFILVLVSCGPSENEDPHQVTKINGRSPIPIYQAEIPTSWIIRHPSSTEDLTDTKLPLCECFIQEGDQKIRITIHNFPSENMEQRIPPQPKLHVGNNNLQYWIVRQSRLPPRHLVGLSACCLKDPVQ